MDLDKYIDSMHPATDKERKKLKKILSGYSVHDNEKGIRKIRVPKDYGIPFRDNLYNWHDLMSMAEKKTFYESVHDHAALVEDEHKLPWLKIHNYFSPYEDDLYVFFPVEDEKEANNIYDFELRHIHKYFWPKPEDKLVIPHFRFNDSDYLYFVTKDLTLSEDEMFDLLVASNVIY